MTSKLVLKLRTRNSEDQGSIVTLNFAGQIKRFQSKTPSMTQLEGFRTHSHCLDLCQEKGDCGEPAWELSPRPVVDPRKFVSLSTEPQIQEAAPPMSPLFDYTMLEQTHAGEALESWALSDDGSLFLRGPGRESLVTWRISNLMNQVLFRG